MKHGAALTNASLLSILFLTLHGADDMVRGMAPAGIVNLIGLLLLAVWLYASLLLADRRSGYVIMLLGALFASWVPIIHMRLRDGLLGHHVAESSGGLFFVWTLLVLSVTGIFSVILSARGLWRREYSSPSVD